MLQGLHRWSEPVARFCRDLELDLGHPCQVNAYITPPGAQGLDLHEDAHDVFVLQAFGRKRWEVHAAPAEEERDPLDVEVTSGDTIYMPAGTPHAARAQDVLSGHLTVGVHVTPWREVLDRRRRTVPAEMDDPVAAGWTEDLEGFADELRERLAALASALGEVDVRTEAGERRERFLSNRAQLARGTIAERAAPIVVDDATVVARRPGTVCELVDATGSARRAPRRPAARDAGLAGAGDAPGRAASTRTTSSRSATSRLHLPDPGGRAVLVRRLDPRGSAHDPRRTLSRLVPAIDDRCSLRSLAADEPLAGTASTIRHWLLIEHPGPWGRDGLLDARLPARARDATSAPSKRRTGARVLLIRKPGRVAPSTTTAPCSASPSTRATRGWASRASTGSRTRSASIPATAARSAAIRRRAALRGLHARTARSVLCRTRTAARAAARRLVPRPSPGRARTSAATGSPATSWPSRTGCTSGASSPSEGPEIARGVRRGPDRRASTATAAGRATRSHVQAAERAASGAPRPRPDRRRRRRQRSDRRGDRAEVVFATERGPHRVRLERSLGAPMRLTCHASSEEAPPIWRTLEIESRRRRRLDHEPAVDRDAVARARGPMRAEHDDPHGVRIRPPVPPPAGRVANAGVGA